MRNAIIRLERLITELQTFDPESIQKRFGPEVSALEKKIEAVLASVFGQGTAAYDRYADAVRLDQGPVQLVRSGQYPRDSRLEGIQFVREGIRAAIATLREGIQWLTDEIEFAGPGPAAPPGLAAAPAPSRKVFIVHGHDNAAIQEVARFVERVDLDPIILHEQASQGRTIIENIEAHGDVGFAVVLLTPDDFGGKDGTEARPRPRQNVVLELGYFYGRLGRARVCALTTSGDMELPSDFVGVVWSELDRGGGWKTALARELKAAGFDIDWNKVME